ncbi:hypothetical protein CULT_10044 [[Clostridium] ultunense Esp]|nr:hypothetical protein CULT_10044 [[Clostridium] ultunense Esp]
MLLNGLYHSYVPIQGGWGFLGQGELSLTGWYGRIATYIQGFGWGINDGAHDSRGGSSFFLSIKSKAND